MPEIKGLIFDKDGTLYHYGDTWSVWCDRVLNELSAGDKILAQDMGAAVGFDHAIGEFEGGSLIVGGAAEEVNAIWRGFVPQYSKKEIDDVAIRHLADLPQKPVGDLAVLFGDLRDAGYRLGIATNDFETGATQQLAKSGISELFDYVVGFDSGYGSKPGAGMILGFCEQMSLEPANVAMIGDSTHDLGAGRAAKVGFNVGVLTGPAEEHELTPHADIVLDSILDLKSEL